jgi:hypothetical protein
MRRRAGADGIERRWARLRRFGEGFTESSQRFHATIAEHLAGMKIAKTACGRSVRKEDTFAQQAREMKPGRPRSGSTSNRSCDSAFR